MISKRVTQDDKRLLLAEIERQKEIVEKLRRQLGEAQMVMNRVYAAEHELFLARAGIAELQHKISLLGGQGYVDEIIRDLSGQIDYFKAQRKGKGRKR